MGSTNIRIKPGHHGNRQSSGFESSWRQTDTFLLHNQMSIHLPEYNSIQCHFLHLRQLHCIPPRLLKAYFSRPANSLSFSNYFSKLLYFYIIKITSSLELTEIKILKATAFSSNHTRL